MPKSVNVIDLISQDKHFTRFLKKCKNGNYNLDTKKIRFDIANMHKTRLTRHLKTRQIIKKYQTKFIDAIVQSTAFRSAIAEKHMICFEVLSDLDESLSILKKYLKSTYSESMKKLYTTQADRDAVIDNLLEIPIRQKKQLETTIAYAQIVLADIDQNGFSFARINEVLKLGAEKRSAI